MKRLLCKLFQCKPNQLVGTMILFIISILFMAGMAACANYVADSITTHESAEVYESEKPAKRITDTKTIIEDEPEHEPEAKIETVEIDDSLAEPIEDAPIEETYIDEYEDYEEMPMVETVEAEPIDGMIYLGQYYITGYDICVECCGKTDGITASGAYATVGRTVAASGEFSFGTVIYIEGIGERVVEDRGGSVNGNHIDVLCNNHEECYAITGWYDVYEKIEVST